MLDFISISILAIIASQQLYINEIYLQRQTDDRKTKRLIQHECQSLDDV